jgi:hypothetical protein
MSLANAARRNKKSLAARQGFFRRYCGKPQQPL